MGPLGVPAWLSDTDDSDNVIGIRCQPVDDIEGARISYYILKAIAYLEKQAGKIPA